MVMRVPVSGSMLVWARERANLLRDDLEARFPKIIEWENEQSNPTLKQLEKLAKAVRVPIGYLFLDAPPEEKIPIPDFRTIRNQEIGKPSPDLLDVVNSCLERQAWYKEYTSQYGMEELNFLGRATLRSNPEIVARDISIELDFPLHDRLGFKDQDVFFRQLVKKSEAAGILVMMSGIVGSNTRRTLNPNEFRGFAIADNTAPLIFINGADYNAARLFTLVHELAHLWLGVSALSDATANPVTNNRSEEIWCNKVAAEFLVPKSSLQSDLNVSLPLDELIKTLKKRYKVSKLVLLRRLLDIGFLKKAEFDTAWKIEMAQIKSLKDRRSSGGNFYNATASRVGRRFATAVYNSTLEGQTLYRDAHRMLGIRKTKTFEELGRSIGVIL